MIPLLLTLALLGPPDDWRPTIVDWSAEWGERHWRTQGAEAWRPLVMMHFPPDDVEVALEVLDCESRGDPAAWNRSDPQGGARGLFQFIGGTWRWVAGEIGVVDPFDPGDNVRAAGWLWANGGPQHWTCWRLR